MGLERTPGVAPREGTRRSRERTFAQLFPWRNMRRVIMLLALIVGIVVIKRSMGPLLGRASQLWGLGSTSSAPPPGDATTGAPTGVGPRAPFRVHLGPTLAPPPKEPPSPSPDR